MNALLKCQVCGYKLTDHVVGNDGSKYRRVSKASMGGPWYVPCVKEAG